MLTKPKLNTANPSASDLLAVPLCNCTRAREREREMEMEVQIQTHHGTAKRSREEMTGSTDKPSDLSGINLSYSDACLHFSSTSPCISSIPLSLSETAFKFVFVW